MSSLNLKKPLFIVKLGGSIITDDQRFMVSRKETILNILLTINEFQNQYHFIIVHGAGSFGHPIAKSYKISSGFQFDEQKLGVILTHSAMIKLNNILLEVSIELGMKLVVFPPISSVVTKNKRIEKWDLNSMGFALKNGFIPITFGDVVFDEALNFTILSGDQIVPYLAEKFSAKKVLMLTDVNGIYSKHPKIYPDAKLLDKFNIRDTSLIHSVFGSDSIDSNKTRVTGEMGQKLQELIPILERDISIFILSGLESVYLRSHLEDKNSKLGTKLIAEDIR